MVIDRQSDFKSSHIVVLTIIARPETAFEAVKIDSQGINSGSGNIRPLLSISAVIIPEQHSQENIEISSRFGSGTLNLKP